MIIFHFASTRFSILLCRALTIRCFLSLSHLQCVVLSFNRWYQFNLKYVTRFTIITFPPRNQSAYAEKKYYFLARKYDFRMHESERCEKVRISNLIHFILWNVSTTVWMEWQHRRIKKNMAMNVTWCRNANLASTSSLLFIPISIVQWCFTFSDALHILDTFIRYQKCSKRLQNFRF